jgi:hypothetical protein
MHKEARYVEERDPAAVGRAHQLVPVPRVPLPVGGLERGEKRRRLRRGRERQQLLPEHEVLPHPAPDDVAEPTAHGEAQRVPVGAAAGVEDAQLAHGRHRLARAGAGVKRPWRCLILFEAGPCRANMVGPSGSPARAKALLRFSPLLPVDISLTVPSRQQTLQKAESVCHGHGEQQPP